MLDFPLAPTAGQVYEQWTWNGEYWELPDGGGAGGGGGGTGYTYVQDTAPTATAEGETWLNDATGLTTGVSHVAIDTGGGVLSWLVTDLIPTFADTTARDAQWINPPVGSLCITLPGAGTLWYRGNTSSWRLAIKALGSSMTVYVATVRPYNMADVTYPKGYNMDISTSYCYIRWRPTADVSTQFNPLALTTTQAKLGSPADTAIVFSVNNAYNNYAFNWSVQLPGDASGLLYMYMMQDAARPTRVKLTIAGNLSADNVPGLLVERLEALEAHVRVLEALLDLPVAERLAQHPPHVFEDPVVPDPEPEPEPE